MSLRLFSWSCRRRSRELARAGGAVALWGVVGVWGTAAAGELPGDAVHRKPFLSGGRAAIGGYIDLEFRADGSGSTFDQHRFVPFIYAEVSERVHVASEIEFEHGGFVAGDEETEGEIKVEFATVDVKVSEALNVRGGLVLSPLGRLNVFHDAPMLDLTDRPLVDQVIIPTTLSEAGLGVFGSLSPSESALLDYELYVVNGFKASAVEDGRLNLREGRGSAEADNNHGRSVVGRLGVSPRLGSEVGVSGHTGDYDDEGRRNLTVVALDARHAMGPLEILGEAAWAWATLPEPRVRDRATGSGFYVEGRYHFLPGALGGLPESVFTGATRIEYVDGDANVAGADQERLTVGVNFRLTEETVLKNDLVFDRTRAAGASGWSDTGTGYRFSIASYF